MALVQLTGSEGTEMKVHAYLRRFDQNLSVPLTESMDSVEII